MHGKVPQLSVSVTSPFKDGLDFVANAVGPHEVGNIRFTVMVPTRPMSRESVVEARPL